MYKIDINLNPSVPPLPRVEDRTKINVRYTLIAPYVSVHIYWDKKTGEVVYEVEEPMLTQNEKILLKTLETSLGEMVNANVLIRKTIESMIVSTGARSSVNMISDVVVGARLFAAVSIT